MKINWGFSPLAHGGKNLKRIAIQREKLLSAEPHSKPPFLPFLLSSLFSLSSPNLTTDITFVHLRSFTFFFPSQIAGCYVNVSQNTPRLHPAATVTGCLHGLCVGS